MQLDGLMLTKQKFSAMVESHRQKKHMPYMDAIVAVCEENNIEIEDVKKYISPSIKEKVEAEAMNLNYLPRKNTLPV